MEKLLIFIKHNLPLVWLAIEWINGILFHVLYGKKMNSVLPNVFKDGIRQPYSVRRLDISDSEALFTMINNQDENDLRYFNPHRFDLGSITRALSNRSMLMMGIFDEGTIAGYFFLRFFANRKCFVGRLIDIKYRGKGIGQIMNYIMYETAWRMGFRCLSTISRNNTAVMKAHASNRQMVVLKELQNNYLLVEFVREDARVNG